MNKKDRDIFYHFRFSDMGDPSSFVRVITNAEEARFNVGVRDDEMGRSALRSVSRSHSDLIDLAAAISAADRHVSYKMDRSVCTVSVEVPVRNPVALNEVAGELATLLHWVTGCFWSFSFYKRSLPAREAEARSQQCALPFLDKDVEVTLWSGGLDALAGLFNRAEADPNKRFVLVGTGDNKTTLGRQHAVHDALPCALRDRCDLLRVPLSTEGMEKLRGNYYSRARGVVFALVGAAAALSAWLAQAFRLRKRDRRAKSPLPPIRDRTRPFAFMPPPHVSDGF